MGKHVPWLERFWAKTTRTDTCWIWKGATSSTGYGQLWRDGRLHYAHRLAYEHFIGPVPDRHELDHLCRVRRCVNPEHLEPVTAKENNRRGAGNQYKNATTCIRGHEFDGHNGKQRTCKTCATIRLRAWRANRRREK